MDMSSRVFGLRNFGLNYPTGRDFAESPWFPVSCVVGYRLLVTLYCASWIIYSIIVDKTWKWPIYLTNWSFLCVTTYFVCSTLTSLIYWAHHHGKVMNVKSGHAHTAEEQKSSQRDPYSRTTCVTSESSDPLDGLQQEEYYNTYEDTEQMKASAQPPDSDQSDIPLIIETVDYCQTWYHKVSWLFYSIAANIAPVVTVVFWTFLYSGGAVREIDVAFHAMNSVFMLIDTCVSSIPVRIFHVVYAELYGIVYIIFTVVYWQCGGTDINGEDHIYPLLNYGHKPYTTALAITIIALAGLPLAQLWNFGIFSLRCYLYRFRSSR